MFCYYSSMAVQLINGVRAWMSNYIPEYHGLYRFILALENQFSVLLYNDLIHHSLVTPYGDLDLVIS